jgi:hypothetical protein
MVSPTILLGNNMHLASWPVPTASSLDPRSKKIKPTKEVFLWSIFVLYLVCLKHNNIKVYLQNLFPVG